MLIIRLKPDSTTARLTLVIRLKPDSTRGLSELCIDFLEVPAIDQHLARLAAGAGRDESFGLHHVHEPRRAAEPNPHLALQIRDGRLARADDDARGLVVELVLLVLDAARPGL